MLEIKRCEENPHDPRDSRDLNTYIEELSNTVQLSREGSGEEYLCRSEGWRRTILGTMYYHGRQLILRQKDRRQFLKRSMR